MLCYLTLSSALSEPDAALSLEEHVPHYNITLLDGLDRFAPEKNAASVLPPLSPLVH